MPKHTALTALLMATLAACGTPPGDAPPAAEYRPLANVQQMMGWILDPAADVIWDNAGTIITADGSRELHPTTDEGWDKIIHAAAIIAESGNLMMMPGRSMGDDWQEYSRGLIDTGELAIAAATAQDPDALFDAGGRIYQVCKACHDQYWIKGREAAAGGEAAFDQYGDGASR